MARVSKYETQTLLRNDPFFRQYASYQGEGVTRRCAEIGDVAKKSYWYSLGFAYSLILDKLSPDWKSKSFDKKLFFEEKFKKLGLL